jgi:ankyrin repeat protein
LKNLLAANPNLANEGFALSGNPNSLKAHPLHRICDAVFAKKIKEKDAIKIAKIFLENGSNIDGDKDMDTPLLAAASLHAEELGVFYIENKANVHYADKNDGATALHWASYCGRDKLVKRLLYEKSEINRPDKSYKSTPLGWAIEPLMTGDKFNTHHQVSCIKLLIKAGADLSKLDQDKIEYLQLLAQDDLELKSLLG